MRTSKRCWVTVLVLHIRRTGHTLHGFMVLSTNPCTTLRTLAYNIFDKQPRSRMKTIFRLSFLLCKFIYRLGNRPCTFDMDLFCFQARIFSDELSWTGYSTEIAVCMSTDPEIKREVEQAIIHPSHGISLVPWYRGAVVEKW